MQLDWRFTTILKEGVSMKIDAKGATPEVVAIITAAIYEMMGTGFVAVKIRRDSDVWTVDGRKNA